MPIPPKHIEEVTNRIMRAWEKFAKGASFGGMTLAQYKETVRLSLTWRTTIESLQDQLDAAIAARNDADRVTLDVNQKVVKGVVGDVRFGEDCEFYAALGYVRKSERKTRSRCHKVPVEVSEIQPKQSMHASPV